MRDRLPAFRLPEIHLPHLPRVTRLESRDIRLRRPTVHLSLTLDLDDPRRLGQPLQFFFYLMMFVALLAIFSGATGTGILMLIAGAGLHVLRSSLEEVAARRRSRRERGERKREVRLREHRAARRAREAARKPAPARSIVAPAAEEIRVVATPRLSARRRQVVAQPGARPARKQRVI
jgi:hypothetical protein